MENPVPRRRRGKVELSLFRGEIEKRLEVESPRQVSDWLKEQGEVISERTLRNYRNSIVGPQKALMRGTLYSRYYELADGKIDALRELYRLVCVQIERLSNLGLKAEQMKGALSGAVSRDLDLLRRILLDVLNIEMDLGIRQRATPEGTEGVMSDEQLRELINTIIMHDRNLTESTEETDGEQ